MYDLEIIEEVARAGDTELDLSNRGMRSLPAEIGKLTKLELLWLDDNKLTSLAGEIWGLRKLKKLDIRNNNLTSLPREVLDIGLEIKWEWDGSLDGVFCEGNPWEVPPVEVVKQGTEAVRNYFKEIKAAEAVEEVTRLYEAKLLIVGEGDVGKTYLKNRLIYDETPAEETTEGIIIDKWPVKSEEGKELTVNFWDFGGQEIYHATHQFFLTKRSLYLFVWQARTDDDLTSFDYWLNVVKLLSGGAPVIMVMNKLDVRTKAIDEKSIQSKFENVRGFHRVSAIKGTGCTDLRESIREEIGKLPHIGDRLPKVWVDIRKELEGLEDNYISYAEYKEICNKFGLDGGRAEFLSRYFHDLGVFLHFADSAILREIIFLRPDWATGAVYKVLDTRAIQDAHGSFSFGQLRRIWADFPDDKFAHLLELMKKFEICFQLGRSQNYIVAELLRPAKPDFEWDYVGNLRFEYHYGFMPAGIITRFIVRMVDIHKGELYWKNGVVLEREETEAVVISERLSRKIRVWIRGEDKKGLLAIIRHDIDYIHETLNRPDVKEMLPCICGECKGSTEPHFFSFSDLMKLRRKGVRHMQCTKSGQDVSIEGLLGEYGLEEEWDRQRGMDDKDEMGRHAPFIQKIEHKVVVEAPAAGEGGKKRLGKKFWAFVVGVGVVLGIIVAVFTLWDRITGRDKKQGDIPTIENKQPAEKEELIPCQAQNDRQT